MSFAHPTLQPVPRVNPNELNNSENMDAGLAKQLQNYEKFSDFTNKRVRNYEILQITHGLDYTS